MLADRDWSVTAIEGLELMRHFDRMPADHLMELVPRSVFIEGRLHPSGR
jgi:hypothetical protein